MMCDTLAVSRYAYLETFRVHTSMLHMGIIMMDNGFGAPAAATAKDNTNMIGRDQYQGCSLVS